MRIRRRQYFGESVTGSDNEVIFKVVPKVHTTQDSVSDITFQQFDDYLLYQDPSFNPDRTCRKMIQDEMNSLGPEGLISYLDESDEIREKVSSVQLDFDLDESVLNVICKLKVPATSEVVKELEAWVRGQLSDGWGEGFEQQPLDSGTVYAVVNVNDEYDVDFFADYNKAERECEDKNNYEPEYEDEDPAEYEVDEVNVEVYYSFHDRHKDCIIDTIVNGINREGYDREGYKDGYDKYGRDREGYDREGFNRNGKDRQGFDKDGNRMTKLGYLLNKADLEGMDPSEYDDLFESRRRRFSEDLGGNYTDKDFSNEAFFYNDGDKNFYKKSGKKDPVKQSKTGPKAIITAEVLKKAGTKKGLVHATKATDFGAAGDYGVDVNGDGKVDDVYVVDQNDVKQAEKRKLPKEFEEARLRKLRVRVRMMERNLSEAKRRYDGAVMTDDE